MPSRILKESVCTSCEIDKLTAEQEILFYRLLVNCDDFGRMDARDPVIISKCYPLRIHKLTDDQVEDWLQSLATVGLVTLYEAEGKRYLFVNRWERHQQKRAKHSKCPEPPQSFEINGNHLQSNVPEKRETRNEKRETLLPDNNILKELLTLPQWGDSAVEDDLKWLTEFQTEVPSFGISQIRACRDYHSTKRKHGKGLWKSRLRNWMRIETERGKDGKGRRNSRQIPSAEERTPTPNYQD